MDDVVVFGAIIGLAAAALTVAVLSSRVSGWTRVPAPAIFLVAAAILSDLVPRLGSMSIGTVQRVVTVALVLILFDGGMSLGWRRLRTSAGPVLSLGVLGTVLTAGAVTLIGRLVGFDWRTSLLLGAALAPTDPATVFSVLGRREIGGRTGTILAGESGANDPVGIAVMVSLLAASGLGGGLVTFVVQMAVGAAVGLVGGWALLWFMRRITLPNEGLYAIRVMAGAGVLFGVATVAHGSGFLAVFLAGILLGDANAPYKRETERFHASLASLAEIVVFTVLGLTVSLKSLPQGYAWELGLLFAALLAFVVRPLAVGPLLAGVRLRHGERIFVLWSGLKGAVPILLGTYVFTAGIHDALRVYDIVIVVVAFSVIVQGGLVPLVARWCGVPMRVVEPEPWALGMRFQHEPQGLRRYVVAAGAPADGQALGDLPVGEDFWVSLITRGGRLIRVRSDTVLRAGDEILALADPEAPEPGRLFAAGHPGSSAAGGTGWPETAPSPGPGPVPSPGPGPSSRAGPGSSPGPSPRAGSGPG